jgi:hypothetical protein
MTDEVVAERTEEDKKFVGVEDKAGVGSEDEVVDPKIDENAEVGAGVGEGAGAGAGAVDNENVVDGGIVKAVEETGAETDPNIGKFEAVAVAVAEPEAEVGAVDGENEKPVDIACENPKPVEEAGTGENVRTDLGADEGAEEVTDVGGDEDAGEGKGAGISVLEDVDEEVNKSEGVTAELD